MLSGRDVRLFQILSGTASQFWHFNYLIWNASLKNTCIGQVDGKKTICFLFEMFGNLLRVCVVFGRGTYTSQLPFLRFESMLFRLKDQTKVLIGFLWSIVAVTEGLSASVYFSHVNMLLGFLVCYFAASSSCVTVLEGRNLSLEEVWSSVHPNFRLPLRNSPLNTITQQVKPGKMQLSAAVSLSSSMKLHWYLISVCVSGASPAGSAFLYAPPL